MTARWSQALFGLLSLGFLVHLSQADCFLPDGRDRNTLSDAPEEDYRPCNPDAKVSMCCALGRRDNISDVCLPSGLCRSKGSGYYWRESCTDQTWESPECLKAFLDGEGSSKDVRLSSCSDGSWCRHSEGPENLCCDRGEGIFIQEGQVIGNNTDTTPDPASTTASDATVAATAVTTSSNSSDDALSTGDKIGIGLGVGFGVILTSVLIAILLILRRRKALEHNAGPSERPSSGQTGFTYEDSSSTQRTTVNSIPEMRSPSAEKVSRLSSSTKERSVCPQYRPPGSQEAPIELESS